MKHGRTDAGLCGPHFQTNQNIFQMSIKHYSEIEARGLQSIAGMTMA